MRFLEHKTLIDSGVEWWGHVPSHWENRSVSQLCSLGRGRVISRIEIDDNVGKFPVYSSQTENDGVLGCINTFDFEGDYLTWTTDGANAGTVFRRRGRFTCTNVCGTLKARAPDLDLSYLAYALSVETRRHVRLDINPKLMNNVMARIRVLLPPFDEQCIIASFLDRKTAEIDTLIAKKQRMIDLLHEKRQALISEAVTKGLDPNVPVKDSGIEWPGSIPNAWRVKKTIWLFQLMGSGTTPSTAIESYYGGDIPWVNTGDLDDGVLECTAKTLTEAALAEHSALRYYPAGTLLIALYGATIGKLAILTMPATVNQACFAMGQPVGIESRFAFYSFLGNRPRIVSMAYGGGQPNISGEIIKQLRMAVPPIEEQNAIVHFLDERLQYLDRLLTMNETQIDKLREYRQTLISAAVTGKIDVRKEVA